MDLLLSSTDPPTVAHSCSASFKSRSNRHEQIGTHHKHLRTHAPRPADNCACALQKLLIFPLCQNVPPYSNWRRYAAQLTQS